VLHNYLIDEAMSDMDILDDSLHQETQEAQAHQADQVTTGTAAGIRHREVVMARALAFREKDV